MKEHDPHNLLIVLAPDKFLNLAKIIMALYFAGSISNFQQKQIFI